MSVIPVIDDPVLALTVAAVVLIGAAAGAGVQRITKFILPIDFITVGILAFAILDSLYGWMDVQKFWYFFLMIGYVFGYYIVGKQAYRMICTVVLKGPTKSIKKRFAVLYDHDDRKCIQMQRWVPLFKRLMFKVHHFISSNAEKLPDDFLFEDKFPLFRMSRYGTLVEWIYEKPAATAKRWRFLKFREYDTFFFVAHGSMVPLAALAMRADALDMANRANDEASKRWIESEIKGKTSARKAARDFIIDAKVEANPMVMLDNHLKSRKALEEAKLKEQKDKETKKEQKKEGDDGRKEVV